MSDRNIPLCGDKRRAGNIMYKKGSGGLAMAEEKAEIIATISRILAQEEQISSEELIKIMELLKKS